MHIRNWCNKLAFIADTLIKDKIQKVFKKNPFLIKYILTIRIFKHQKQLVE